LAAEESSLALTVIEERSLTLTAKERSRTLTAKERSLALTAEEEVWKYPLKRKHRIRDRSQVILLSDNDCT
jgi:hypothetical protein